MPATTAKVRLLEPDEKRSSPMTEPLKLRNAQAHCKDCSLASLCLPLSLDLKDLDALDQIGDRLIARALPCRERARDARHRGRQSIKTRDLVNQSGARRVFDIHRARPTRPAAPLTEPGVS